MAVVVDRKIIDLLIETQGEQALKEIARNLQLVEQRGREAARSLNAIKATGLATLAGVVGRELGQAMATGIKATIALNEELAKAGDKGAQGLIGNLQALEKQTEEAQKEFSDGLTPALTDIVASLVSVAKQSGVAKFAGEALGFTLKALTTGFLLVGLVINRAVLAAKAFGDVAIAIANGDLVALRAAADDVKDAYFDIFNDPAFVQIKNLWNDARESAGAYTLPVEKAAKATKALSRSTKESSDASRAAAEALREQQRAVESLSDEVNKYLDNTEGRRDSFNDRFDPAINRQNRLQEITDAGNAGASTTALDNALKEYVTSLAPKTEEAVSATERLRAELRGLGGEYERLGKDVAGGVGSVFGQFITGAATAKQALGDLVNYAIVELTRLAAQEFFTKLLGGIGAGDGGIGGFVAGLFQAKGGAWEGGVQKYAQGGVVGGPTLFRSRGGLGLMGEAGPEAIIPLRRDARGSLGVGSSPVVVNITNNAGVQVRAVDQGQGQIAILIDQARRAIAADLRAGGGMVSSTMERTYGLRRATS